MEWKGFFLAGLAFHGLLDVLPKGIEWILYAVGIG